MASASLARDIQSELYEDCKLLIYDTVHKFTKRYGGDFDELCSDAGLLFVQAYQEYDPQRDTKFSTWMRFFIWTRLLENLRKTISRNKLMPRVVAPLELFAAYTTPTFDPGPLLERLGDDARTVVRLIVETPQEVWDEVQAKGGQVRNWRSVLRSTLKGCGWTIEQIEDSFAEIWRALRPSR